MHSINYALEWETIKTKNMQFFKWHPSPDEREEHGTFRTQAQVSSGPG